MKHIDFSHLLRNRNLKATPIRLEMLSTIAGHEKAMPYSEIQQALQNFDRVTLYRTINSLLEHGIIHKAMADEKDTFYALCSTQCNSQRHNHRHIHFKCTRCESVSCLPVETSTELDIPGHIVNELRIEASGICASCNQ